MRKYRVIYQRKGFPERRSPWFLSRDRAHRALEIVKAKGYQAIIWVD